MVNVNKAIINHLYIYFIVFLHIIYRQFGGRLTIALLTLYIAFAFNQLTPNKRPRLPWRFGAPGLESHWEPGKVHRSDEGERHRETIATHKNITLNFTVSGKVSLEPNGFRTIW